MGRYLEIADQVISGADNQPLAEPGPNFGSPTQCKKSELSEISPEQAKTPQVRSVDQLSKKLQKSPDELRRAAGDDWEWVPGDPATLIGFADSLAIKQIRESGNCPDSYTSETECKHCGTVPIFPGCPPQVNGCPWCFNRRSGLPIPGVNEMKAVK